ncbi:MAG TPA: hypothetical protein DEQ14_11475 [Treponema sp.]|nr:hypothetical protein [Treponema sp.]
MEKQILTDPMTKPESNVLADALGKDYKKFTDFAENVNEKGLVLEWNYYNDGKSWLCKILNKKKNLGWLSVWDTGFRLTFYFTEKTIGGIYDLDIDDSIKNTAKETKSVGKLLPVILPVKNKKTLDDGLKILEYKMTLK